MSCAGEWPVLSLDYFPGCVARGFRGPGVAGDECLPDTFLYTHGIERPTCLRVDCGSPSRFQCFTFGDFQNDLCFGARGARADDLKKCSR